MKISQRQGQVAKVSIIFNVETSILFQAQKTLKMTSKWTIYGLGSENKGLWQGNVGQSDHIRG